jgi:hypothetical protein
LDKGILDDFAKIIEVLYELFEFDKLYLVDTGHSGSIEATNELKNKYLNYLIKKRTELVGTSSYLNNEMKFSESKFIDFINSHSSKNNAILVSYIPKNWVLRLHEERQKWAYFCVVKRPEYSSTQDEIRLQAFAVPNK